MNRTPIRTNLSLRPIASRRMKGVGLIEVMIAVVILAVGMLGIAALQAVTLKNSGSSSERTQAMIHVYGMGDTLRANKGRLAAFNTSGYRCSADVDPDDENPNADLNAWLQRLVTDVAPTACGSIDCPAGNICTVMVRWNDERGTGGTSDPVEIVTDIRM